jgi:hypothetical protein
MNTLRHMLGINTPHHKEPKPYRNHAAVNPGNQEFQKLEKQGLVEKMGPVADGLYPKLQFYRCTETGKALAMSSHRSIRLKKAARVYRLYLDLSDTDSELTFKEFLINPAYAEMKREA